ncbi:MAG: esterase family protein [Alphaproteobacteria bacterium]|nr:esterase family protein [Alphaproteobacteria bacterium]
MVTALTDLPRGRLTRLIVDGTRLEGNFLGEPTARDCDLWIPHGHDGKGLPLVLGLAGFTGSGLGMTAWKAFVENLPERLDRLSRDGVLPPCVVAFPDCWTKLGGNQFINSPAMGDWQDFLVDDVVPQVEAALGCGGPGRRAAFGHSSGGFGALRLAMDKPGAVDAIACHSGDMAFDLVYGADFPMVLDALAKHGGVAGFWEQFEKQPKKRGGDIHILMMLAMAASYDADISLPFGIRMPVDPETAEMVPERWAAWLAHDPVERVEATVEALKRLKLLFIDCGAQDEYKLHYGARRLVRKLRAAGVEHLYEEFNGGHSGVNYRYDVSLPMLVKALG